MAKEMMEEQVTNKWPGLVEEVNEMCASMRIEDPKTRDQLEKGLIARWSRRHVDGKTKP